MDVSLRTMGFLILVSAIFERHAYCQKAAVVKIGAVFTYDSVIGRGAKAAMEMAVEDVNSDPRILNGTQLELVMEDSSCSVFIGSIKGFPFLLSSNHPFTIAHILFYFFYFYILFLFVHSAIFFNYWPLFSVYCNLHLVKFTMYITTLHVY